MKKIDLSLVAYCGLYCPKCYKMKLSAAAEKLKQELNNPHLCGKKANIPSTFFATLNDLIALRCNKYCKKSGGKYDCQIKICNSNKNLNGCWECLNYQSCPNLSKQFLENIKRIKEIGLNHYIKERCD